ncbi:DUF2789 domain-containing protein [Thiomicrorhabdus sp. ZW0627]|uniref:DUF2789 domain-containing protein n=1 Tax=Thiomicrorhabdus sp. ZW0627 TaxID=3039774 RepID=UPI002436F6BC|nr:DUF2789 domain-containing protein [Thiomicrorhabdus sp. ZW0627]MDG6773910.1 DUF2789 domain-containing protein [Thiomicrorhabdus sp. ZW0627]
MEAPVHSLNSLFEQLGLPSSDAEIDAFINTHKTMADTTHLPDAPFWTPSQSAFLTEAIDDDADWAEVVDQLDAMLRN